MEKLKRYERIDLCGKYFTLDNKIIVDEFSMKSVTIYKAYKNPSFRKIDIWENWLRWFNDNNGRCFVSSHNSNFFTIEGYIRKSSDEVYWCRITPANNYCYKMVVHD